jgi:hypothetical protein
MGNKNGTYETLSEETKELLMQRTSKIIFIRIYRNHFFFLSIKYFRCQGMIHRGYL